MKDSCWQAGHRGLGQHWSRVLSGLGVHMGLDGHGLYHLGPSVGMEECKLALLWSMLLLDTTALFMLRLHLDLGTS